MNPGLASDIMVPFGVEGGNRVMSSIAIAYIRPKIGEKRHENNQMVNPGF